MKRVNKSNISFADVFKLAVSQSVSETLIQKGIEQGSENPIKSVDDVAKKGGIGKIIGVLSGKYQVELDSGEVVVASSNNVLGVDVFFDTDNYKGGSKQVIVAVGYHSDGTAYIYGILNNAVPSDITISSNNNITMETGLASMVISGGDSGGDGFGGLVIASRLEEKLSQMAGKLNLLIQLYNAHVHPTDGSPTPSTYPQSFDLFDSNDWTNKSINHTGRV